MTEPGLTLTVIQEGKQRPIALPQDRIITSRTDMATPGKYDPNVKGGGGLWAMWGSSDDLPTAWRQQIEQSDIAGATVGKIAELMYGDGLYWAADWGMSHKEGLSDEINREIEDWVDRNRIETHYLPAQFADYRLYMNTFTELWWDASGKKIAGIGHKAAEHCRLGMQDSKGNIPFVIYSPDFTLGTTPPDDRMASIAYYDWGVEDPLSMVSGENFIDHAYYPTPGMTYYAMPWWAGLFRKDGWINVSINVPELISKINTNKVRLLYVIYIPNSYFMYRYSDWNEYDDKKKQAVRDKQTKDINDMLQASDNYYTSLVTYFEEQPGTNTPSGKIVITPIGTQDTHSDWMPDSNISDAKIVQGLGLHPSQMGLAPEGGKMGAGSGSDQRESFNTQNALINVHEAIILSRFNLIVSRVNGWGAKFWMGKERHVTKEYSRTGVAEQPSAPGA